MANKIKVEITTLSNLFIGGAPTPFEIGGVDQYTATTFEDAPYIPASSFKGALRNIVHEDTSKQRTKIAAFYQHFLDVEKETHEEYINQLEQGDKDKILRRYSEIKTTEALFGIKGLNNAPKLLFGDMHLKKEYNDKSKWFSIDAKTAIESNCDEVVSNPRTYKAARSGLVFEGEILLFKIHQLDETAVKLCGEYIIDMLNKFNDGYYRLGNSKSRGYGRIEVRAKLGCEVTQS